MRQFSSAVFLVCGMLTLLAFLVLISRGPEPQQLNEITAIAASKAKEFTTDTTCMVASNAITQSLTEKGYFAFTQVIGSKEMYENGTGHQITIVAIPIENTGRLITPKEWQDNGYYFIRSLGDENGCQFNWYNCWDYGHCGKTFVCNPKTGGC